MAKSYDGFYASTLEIFLPKKLKKEFLLTPTWFEHAAFWSGVRRATVAPRSQICRLLANLIRAHPCGLSVLFGKIRKLVDQNKSKRWRQKDCLLLKKREKEHMDWPGLRKWFERDRTRTCNPQIRSLVPYPLGHTPSATLNKIAWHYLFLLQS